jgi:hypothetical protein
VQPWLVAGRRPNWWGRLLWRVCARLNWRWPIRRLLRRAEASWCSDFFTINQRRRLEGLEPLGGVEL